MQDTLVAAIRGLKVFFIDAHERNDLGPAVEVWKSTGLWPRPCTRKAWWKKHNVGLLRGQEVGVPLGLYRDWLRRQYSHFHVSLLALIAQGAPGTAQVLACPPSACHQQECML